MTAEQLRNSILQEAISGRLVAQDPNDEPVSALLARIREEKERLIKEKKLKKDKPSAPITEDEKPFEIPSSWEWVRYRDIANCLLGKTKNPHQLIGTMCPYLCSINVYWDKIKLSNIKEMLFSDTDMRQYGVSRGDMLICEGGEAGRAAIYDGDIEPIYFQNALHRVRFYGNICARFYLHQIEFYKKTGLLDEHIKGETIQHFVLGKLQDLPIPLPPLAEQQRIVAKLEELLPIVEQYGKAQTELDELNAALPARLRQSILLQAMQGKLVPQDKNEGTAMELLQRIDAEKQRLIKEKKLKKEKPSAPITEDEKPYEIPATWEWVRLSSYLDVRDGTHDSPKYYPSGIPFVTSKNLKNGKIDFSSCTNISSADHQKFSERSYVEDGDILFAMIGSIGNPVIVRKDREFSIKNVALFKRYSKELTNVKYLFYYLLYIQNELKQIAAGGVQSFVGLGTLRQHLIPIPPLAEQQRIVAKIEELFAEIDKLK